ncbi:MAG: hypothetical protein LBG58_08455 [Planctomycetaceae bacterium]|jgi:GH35 family endo-1,4-beta-xylanase|nr:hypothetical protein [Planctomycetaceae bacterium]
MTRGMPVDFISLQFHVFDNRWLQEAYSPASVRKAIVKFGDLGVPVEIAELGGYFGIDLKRPQLLRSAVHDPVTKAALIKNMYKFFFSLVSARK